MPDPFNLLVLDASRQASEKKVALLDGAGLTYVWQRTSDSETFRSRLATGDFDLVLADYDLAECGGMVLLGLFLERGLEIPLIFVSDRLETEFVVDALKAGATDFVFRDNFERLPSAVLRALSDHASADSAEEALKRSENRLKQALHFSHIGIFEHDHRSGEVHFSPELRAMNGWDSDESVTLAKIIDQVHPHDAARIAAAIRRAHDPSGDGIYDVEYRVIRRDGVERWHKAQSRTVFEGEGDERRAMRTLGARQDITESRHAEAERENLISELEASNTDLERKNAELEQFNYTVSHDLKNPLVTIKGYAGLLQISIDQNAKDKIKSDLAMISQAADHMHRLLEELLNLSRAGHVVELGKPVPLGEVFAELLALMQSSIKAHPVEISVQEDMPIVAGDPLRLHEVFQNLIENAFKFRDKDRDLRIEIGAEEQKDDVLCWVRDNGIGINPRYQHKIFGLFERLDQTREGTGVGLALVKRIVEFHGGQIRVKSEGDRKGATFYVSLPRWTTKTSKKS